MNSKNKFSLNVLDEYARILTHAQASRLFEAKTKKKYNKALFESTITENSKYTFYLNNATIYDDILPGGMFDSIEDIQNYFEQNYPIEIDVVNQDEYGITLITSDPKVYNEILLDLEEMGVSPEKITDGIDELYLKEN